jgi:hypothetical protein
MTRERRAETVLLLLLIAALFVFLWRAPRSPQAEPVRLTALGAVPQDIVLLITVDADALRKSEWGGRLLDSGKNLQGLGAIDELCQNSPLTQLKELALFVPKVPSEQDLDVGVVAQGAFDSAQTLTCIERVVSARGGAPIRSVLGSFESVRDRGSTQGEIAMRNGGPLILGEGRTLRAAIDTAEGRNPNVRSNEAHSGLRAEVGEHAIVVSLLLPPGWLTRMTRLDAARVSPLAQVRAAAIGIDLAPVCVEVVLGCEAEALAQEVARILVGFSRDSAGLMQLELGANPLENAKVEARGRTVRLSLAMDEAQLSALSRSLLGQLPAPALRKNEVVVEDLKANDAAVGELKASDVAVD